MKYRSGSPNASVITKMRTISAPSFSPRITISIITAAWDKHPSEEGSKSAERGSCSLISQSGMSHFIHRSVDLQLSDFTEEPGLDEFTDNGLADRPFSMA